MKILKNIILLLLLALVSGCATSIKTSLSDKTLAPLTTEAKIIVIGLNDGAPDGRAIGSVKVGDSGFTTDCGYNTVIEQAKTTARKAGGNAIKLTKVKEPSLFGSTCYRIEADIYVLNNADAFEQKSKAEQDLITKSKFPANPDYALLYVYRRSSMNGSLLNYTIHWDGEPLFKIYNGTKKMIKITKEGVHKVRASLETEEIKEIDIKFGEEYFLECSVNMGVFIGRPELNFVDKAVGREQYNKIDEVLK